ncbi:hypothetical protein MJ435_18625, partial [Burkholderia gladioli]
MSNTADSVHLARQVPEQYRDLATLKRTGHGPSLPALLKVDIDQATDRVYDLCQRRGVSGSSVGRARKRFEFIVAQLFEIDPFDQEVKRLGHRVEVVSH